MISFKFLRSFSVSVLPSLGKRLAIILQAQYQSTFFSNVQSFFVDELARVRLRGFALAFDPFGKATTLVFKAIIRTASQKFPGRCSPCCCSIP